MACDSLLTTSLLQVVNRLVASLLSKLIIHRLAASLQMTSCNKPDLTDLLKLTCCSLIKLTSLLQFVDTRKNVKTFFSCNKPEKLRTCKKDVVFFAV